MTDWIVSNAWWFAPTLAFAGVGMFVGALLWPRKAVVDPLLRSPEHQGYISVPTVLQPAVDRRGRHLRTD